MNLNKLSGWVLLIILIFSAAIRYRLLGIPLERDEGEYAYAAQLILQGIPPYEHLYNMKLPGVYAVYALIISIFGQTQTAIHFGLLLINSATIILVYVLGRNLFNSLIGLTASAFFAILSLGQSVQGMHANAEHFVILPVIGGLIVLLKALEKDRLSLFFISGFLLGLGFVMKQHGIAFVFAGLLIAFFRSIKERPFIRKKFIFNIFVLLGGIITPYVFTCLLFLSLGVFDQFWFWTVEYAREYTSLVSFEQGFGNFKNNAIRIFRSSWVIWLLVVYGFVTFLWNKEIWKHLTFLLIFVIFSFMAILPGFYFRPHYFIMFLPAASILAGLAISSLVKMVPLIRQPLNSFTLGIFITVVVLAFTTYQQRTFLFMMTPFEASRSTYGHNPFPESIEIGNYLKEHTKEDDPILVFGSEPQIYFYAQRKAATGFVYTYALMDKRDFALDFQERIITEIVQSKPLYIVNIDPASIPWSWLKGEYSHKRLFNWFENYKKQHYTRVGVVELYSDSSSYSWNEKVKKSPYSEYWLEVLKRKPGDE